CGNCAGAGQCNLTTGYCDEGCTPGFMNFDCRQKIDSRNHNTTVHEHSISELKLRNVKDCNINY
ncbi:hypothetical protein BgiBS90_027984, partial [Biomphalaria glabrata]